MKILSILSAAVLLGGAAVTTGCASYTAKPAPYAVGDASFVGWVRFSGQEFQLNADEDQVLQPLGRPCISGGVPRDLRAQTADLANQKVRVVGRGQVWNKDQPGGRIDYQGTNIRNDCGGAFVILATSITPIP